MESSIPYQHFDQFFFRCPKFPYSLWDEDFLNCELFKEALYISSPEFYKTIKDKTSLPILPQKIQNTLLKFYQRMRSRCTPFGIFAGIGVGEVGKHQISTLVLDQKDLSTRTRFDVSFISRVIDFLLENQDLLSKLTFYTNTSLYKFHPYYRYVEYQKKQISRNYQLATLDVSDYLSGVLSMTDNGVDLGQIKKYLKQFEEQDSDIDAYISELLNEQVLVSDLEPSLTNGDPFKNLITKLKLHYSTPIPTLTLLNELLTQMEEIDLTQLGKRVEKYRIIQERVESTQFSYDNKYLFQTDLCYIPKISNIDSAILDCVWQGLYISNKFSSITVDKHLEQFKQKFLEKYEMEEVPLVEALDIDFGVGLGDSNSYITDISPLIKDLKAVNKTTQTPNGNYSINEVELFLYEKYQESVANSKEKVYITDEEIKKFDCDWHIFPDTLSVIFNILDITANENEPQIFFKSATGMTGARIISRFGHLDKKIEDLLEKIVRKENTYYDEDFILAEVTHLPETRMGNVLITSNLREYEIPYLTQSLKPKEKQIPVSDIMVSVRNNQILLRSNSQNKFIIPRITNAYNFTRGSLSIYEFLGRLQFQNRCRGFAFSWGPLVKNKPFTPRVIYKKCILAPATWNFNTDDTRHLLNKKENSHPDFIKKYNLPDRILLKGKDGDDVKLFIDFQVPALKSLFFQEIAGKSVKVEEFLFTSGSKNFAMDTEMNYYTNEVILPVFKSKKN